MVYRSKINAKSTDLKQSFLGSQSKYENCGKRMKILDKIYMQNISHIMATGRNSEKVLGLGIEITDVSCKIFCGLKLSCLILPVFLYFVLLCFSKKKLTIKPIFKFRLKLTKVSKMLKFFGLEEK